MTQPVDAATAALSVLPAVLTLHTATVTGNVSQTQTSSLSKGDTAWILFSTALVFMMTPALALFYGGLVSNKHIINTLFLSFVTMSLVTVQWCLFGYSFAFGYGNKVWGDFNWSVLRFGESVNTDYSPTYPQLVHTAYQCAFAVITSALITGSMVGRMKVSSYLIFTALWTALVYDALAHWVWSRDGWLHSLGALDFAGGTVIHISSGCSALVAALILGPRLDYDRRAPHVPSNIPFTFIGAAFLWIGWIGFNAGSAGSAGGVAALACINTNVAAAAAMLTWVTIEAVRHRPTLTGACSGAVAGLVAITPAAGYVSPGWSIVFGIVASLLVYPSLSLKSYLTADDTLDVFAIHGVGGIIGAVLTGLFSEQSLNSSGFDGAFHGRPIQLANQLTAVITAIAWSCVLTALIMLLLKCTIGIRVKPHHEQNGIDNYQHGETWLLVSQDVVVQMFESLKKEMLSREQSLQFQQAQCPTGTVSSDTPSLKEISTVATTTATTITSSSLAEYSSSHRPSSFAALVVPPISLQTGSLVEMSDLSIASESHEST